ncbi:MAG: CsgG/HfaB family protein [bacterium]|nr:CsgG/HfaB family protein [bacterium]
MEAKDKAFIAVLDFSLGPDVNPELKVLLSQELAKDLFQTGKFRVLDRKNINAILKEQGFSLQDCTSTDCIVQVGKLLVVQKIITGDIRIVNQGFGDAFVISAIVTNVETGEVEANKTISCHCRGTEFFDNIKIISDSLIDSLAGINLTARDLDLQLLFNDVPISKYTALDPVIEIHNSDTQKIENKQTIYNRKTGFLKIPNFTFGRYWYKISINANPSNPPDSSGDYIGGNTLFFNKESSSLIINMVRYFKLIRPEFNDDTVIIIDTKNDSYYKPSLKNPLSFSWEPFGSDVENIIYSYIVIIHDNSTGGRIPVALENQTKNTQVTLDLPPNKGTESYEIDIFAKNGNGTIVGRMAPANEFNNGFRFRVEK